MTEVPTRQTHPELWNTHPNRGHLPQPRNPRAMNGGPGGTGWVSRRQGGGGPGYYVRNGIYVPLRYINPGNPLMGGYGYCDWTDGGLTPHPGVDLNSGSSCNDDEGTEVVASTDGVVLAVLPWDGYTSGEGNHLWVYYDDPRCIAPAWAHFDHFQSFAPGLGEGQRVKAGQMVGLAGRTGNWDCAHAHCELAQQQPSSWWQWPYAWPRSRVEAAYFDPGWWYSQTADKAGGMGDTVPMDTTPEERAAMQPYFELYGIGCNMDTAIMQRAALAYKREETRGPAISGEYPATAPDGVDVTRQNFTAGIAEAKPLPDGTWQVGWVEVVANPDSLGR
jgi:hypothetical protein